MIYILAPLGFAYFTIGLFWALNHSVKDELKPRVVGDVVMMILFLPFAIILFILHVFLDAMVSVLIKLTESNWWNKKI